MRDNREMHGEKTTQPSFFQRTIRQMKQVLRHDHGVSAVEFALLSPILVLGSFATVDAGMAVYEEMMISNTLRSGAHLAISAESEAQILSVLQTVAAENFTVASGTPATGELSATVANYCICPTDGSAEVNCTTTCSSGADPQEFYTLSASKEFVGIILPDFTLSGTIDVMAQ